MTQPKDPLSFLLSPEICSRIEREASYRGISSADVVSEVLLRHFETPHYAAEVATIEMRDRDSDPQDWESLEEQFEDLV